MSDRLVAGSKVFIPWSGGLDSTSLVNFALESKCKVTTAYFNIQNNENKVKCELEARSKMIAFFDKKAIECGATFSDLGTIITFDFATGWLNAIGLFTQTPLWVLGAAYTAKNYDYVAMGFVKNDDTPSWAPEYKALFNQYKKINSDLSPKSNVKLVFPIMRTDKEELYATLPDKLKEHLWVCELPIIVDGKYFACGCCKPCKHHVGRLPLKDEPLIDEMNECKEKLVALRDDAVPEILDVKEEYEIN